MASGGQLQDVVEEYEPLEAVVHSEMRPACARRGGAQSMC